MNRLDTIRDLIPEGSVVVDLGTDHCKLPNRLVEDGFYPVYATEASEGPLSQARRHARPEVKLSLHDGLLGFTEEVDTVVIAGMGGELIKKILSDSEITFRRMNSIILQPMQQIASLRQYLLDHDYRLLEERLSQEGEKFYQVMALQPGEEETYDTRFFKGDSQDPELLRAYYQKEIRRMHELLTHHQSTAYLDYLEGLEHRVTALTQKKK